MNKRQARRTILDYLISTLRAAKTCDSLKDEVSDADLDRLCDAETHWADVFERMIAEGDV